MKFKSLSEVLEISTLMFLFVVLVVSGFLFFKLFLSVLLRSIMEYSDTKDKWQASKEASVHLNAQPFKTTP